MENRMEGFEGRRDQKGGGRTEGREAGKEGSNY